METSTRFIHVRDKAGNPIATVAMKKRNPLRGYHAALSVCSKKDCFSRKRGRVVAEGRLVSNNKLVHHDPLILSYMVIDELLGFSSRMVRNQSNIDTSQLGRSILYVCRLIDDEVEKLIEEETK